MAAMVFLTAALCAIPAMAAMDMFIKIDGIDGESRDKDHSGWIEVESFSWEHMGISVSGQRASAIGSRQGEPAMPGSLTVTKFIDKASFPIMRACSSEANIGDVVVNMVETDEITEIVSYRTYTLSGVSVSGCSAADSEDPPTETFTLNYDEISYRNYTIDRKTGKTRKTK
jgi:type VI secretion system secreted protein Hcp